VQSEWLRREINFNKTYEDAPIRVSWKSLGALDMLDELSAKVNGRIKDSVVGIGERIIGKDNVDALSSTEYIPSFHELMRDDIKINAQEGVIYVCVIDKIDI